MEQLPETDDGNQDVLEQLMLLGYEFVLLRSGEKRPLYQGWQRSCVTIEDMKHAQQQHGANLGIKTGGRLIVLDIDSDDPKKLAWVEKYVGNTPMKVQTPSGGLHCYFRTRKGVTYGNKVRLRGEPLDFRHEGAFVVCPPSRTVKGAYHWLGDPLPIAELPILRVSALRERNTKRKPIVIEPEEQVDQMIYRAQRYLEKILSISGEGGHNACFRAACRCRDFGLNPQQAFQLLLSWNETNAQPPWSEAELLHKVEDAYRLNK